MTGAQKLGCDWSRLGLLRLFQRKARVGEIGAGILQVGVEKLPIMLVGEVIVVCYVAPRRAARIALLDPRQNRPQRPNGRVARHAPLLQLIAPNELEQIPERPALEDQSAVHVKFAEIEVRMQRELQRGERALEPYGHLRTRLCGCQFAELFLVAVGSNDRYAPVLYES